MSLKENEPSVLSKSTVLPVDLGLPKADFESFNELKVMAAKAEALRKASARTAWKAAIASSILTVLIAFLIVVPVRAKYFPDAEVRTEQVVKEISQKIQNQIADTEQDVIEHRLHSCAQHAATFLASLDPAEVKEFNREELLKAFSMCPKDLQFDKILVDPRHGP